MQRQKPFGNKPWFHDKPVMIVTQPGFSAVSFARLGALAGLSPLCVTSPSGGQPEWRSAMYRPGEVPSAFRNIVTKLGTLS